MFDSPLEWCIECKVWVAIDQTFTECARARACGLDRCPLAVFLRANEEPRLDAAGDPQLEPR